MVIEAVAYLSHGRWVAHCPRPGCPNAEGAGRCDDGSAGGLGAEGFRCRVERGGCGLRCPAVWPPEVAEIERLVLCRPIPATRNWVPGESLSDLLRENMTHGLVPNDELEIRGSAIVGGALSAPSFSALTMGGR